MGNFPGLAGAISTGESAVNRTNKNLGMAWGRFLLGRYLAYFVFFSKTSI